MIECDVLVVGGGPAGLSASEAASGNALDVICVEKKEKIGIPVQCAEGIGGYLLDRLPFKFPKRFLEWDIEGLVFITGEKKIIRKGKNWAGYSISRDKVEPWLASRAEHSGAKIFTGTEFLKADRSDKTIISFVRRKNKVIKIKSKYLIGADGVLSTVADSIGMKEKPGYSPGYVYSWEVEGIELDHPEFEYLFLGEFSPNGYGYIFPRSVDRANIGVGDLFGKKGIEQKFKQFINNKRIKGNLKNARFVIEKSGEAPFITRHPISDRNVFFIGDSANHNIKPFIEGFLPAIILGYELGKKIEELDTKSYMDLVDKTLPEISESAILIEPMIEFFKRSDNERFHELLDLMISSFDQ